MVQRRFLTPNFVNSVQPPAKGEVWIADTKIKGFGLRLFASSRTGKSLSIRLSDERGRIVRRSFDTYRSRTYRSAFADGRFDLQLGDFLDDARSWAQTEIYKLKNLHLTEEEDRRDREEVGRLVREMTFKRAAESLINGLSVMGRSQVYTTSLFSILKYVPDQLMQKTLADITPKEMAEAIVNNGIEPGNVRKLRSLVVQVYKRASDFRSGLWKVEDELSKHFQQRLETQYDPYPGLRELKLHDCERVLEYLENEDARWQQAMCVRLYFEVGAPLNRLMQAEWRTIYGEYWYPYLPSDKKHWFEDREHFKREITVVIILRQGTYRSELRRKFIYISIWAF